MNILETLQWRYATKRMNGQRVPSDKVERILEAIRLAPSSNGLQPYSVLLIEDEDLKKQIRTVANNQPQIEESSHLLVFAAWDDLTPAHIEEFISHTASERNMPVENLQGFKDSLLGMAAGKTQEQNFNWAARQAYLAFGVGLLAAAAEKVDATPMEGFDAAALDQLLDLPAKGLRSVTLMPLGYRDADNDWLANLPKVRRQKEKFVLEA
ncbi:NAD(P)H-dependent oxidoreductase [Pontibacter sp. BT731]|uniref:NAD(P)H-dependent oxidoreductase n=1 Tax=Pontibacter coccineus TaxID=3063328 RepID=UPI0026E3B455|nr:NAD(P)H-dependent oxidoreductase [Pontibacter sp. BT731]MDO6388785.1 NAD(P)H-dependent oxidoreductase [Pontibacter sp. BT731]